MTGTDPQVMTEDKVIGIIAAEAEPSSEFELLIEKRMFKISGFGENRHGGTTDISVPLRLFHDGREGDNEAIVFLLAEELPVFIQALIDHPILLPTSYSQQVSMERGMSCLQLKTREPFEDFKARLFKALTKLG